MEVKRFSCEKCNYNTAHKQNYERHLQSVKHLEVHEENIVCFSCDLCKYSTPDKFNYERHLKSNKHLHKIKPPQQNELTMHETIMIIYILLLFLNETSLKNNLHL